MIQEIWNKTLETRKERYMSKRDHLWASELGKAPVDVWLKLNAVKPTNPPDARALRKFEAGNLIEWVVEMVLKRAGAVLIGEGDKGTQKWVSHQYPNMMEVTGKIDIMSGNKNGDYTSNLELDDLRLPPIFTKLADNIKMYLEEEYPTGLDKVPVEVKSCSSYMYEVYANQGASDNHKLQLFHYLKADDCKKGIILYVSKDDLRLLEFIVMNPSPVEDMYKERIATLTKYINEDKRPPLEKFIEFNMDSFKFKANWKVMYSDYLTLLYGFEHQESFRTTFDKKVNGYNRVVKRIVQSKKITDKNKEIITEMEKEFPNYKDVIILAQKSGLFDEEVKEDDSKEK